LPETILDETKKINREQRKEKKLVVSCIGEKDEVQCQAKVGKKKVFQKENKFYFFFLLYILSFFYP